MRIVSLRSMVRRLSPLRVVLGMGARARAEQARYREIVESAVDAIYTTDADVVVTDVNPAGCAMMRCSREEIVGRPIADLIHPDEIPAIAALMAELPPGGSVTREWRLRLPDGAFLPVEVTSRRLPDGRFQGITRDITARKQAEGEMRRILGQQRVIAELAQRALAETDVQRLLGYAVGEVASTLSAPLGAVLELLPGGAAMRLRAGVGWNPGEVGRATVGVAEDTQAGYTLARRTTVVVEDLHEETRFTGASLLGGRGVVSGISVVIPGTERPFGVLAVYVATRRRFTSDEVHFVEVAANVLAQSLEKSRTTEALKASDRRYQLAAEHLRDSADRLASLSRRLIDAQEAERRHVARELHDEIGQALTALKLNLQLLAERRDGDTARLTLEESIQLTDRTLQQTRDLSLGLRPALLDDLGLVPALRWYLDRQGRRAGFATEFAVAAVDDGVPPEIATTCFRIAQEALTNVARHARATRVTMELSRRGTVLELVVRDSGRGFDPRAVSARTNGRGTLGILSMSERAALVGGELVIDSAIGSGTEVRVRLPLA